MNDMVVKQIIRIATSVTVGTVVGNAVKSTTPAEINILGKVLIFIGESVLSAMVADKAADYVMDQISEIKGEVQVSK